MMFCTLYLHSCTPSDVVGTVFRRDDDVGLHLLVSRLGGRRRAVAQKDIVRASPGRAACHILDEIGSEFAGDKRRILEMTENDSFILEGEAREEFRKIPNHFTGRLVKTM